MGDDDGESKRPTEAQKLRGLRWSVGSEVFGSSYGVLVFGTVFVLYLNELGLSKEQIGLINGLIFLPGPIALFIAPYIARFGFKRTLILFYGARKFVAACLLFTPGVLVAYGQSAAFVFVLVVMGFYGLFRVIAETAFYPWIHEFVPNSVRGQYMAVYNIIGTLMGMVAVAWSSYVVGAGTGIGRFQVVMGVGCVLGIIGVMLKTKIPGGAPQLERIDSRSYFRQMRAAFGDPGFRRFLIGLGIVGLASGGWGTFVPLYLKEAVGLKPGLVVGLHNWTLAGTLISCYVWGFTADRKGSKPVLLAGLLLMVLVSLGWITLPREEADSVFWARILSLFSGAAMMGYSLGNERLLFVSAVPAEKKTEYMAVFYTFTQIMMALSPFVAGWMLLTSQNVAGSVSGIVVDQYALYFASSLFLMLLGLWVFIGVRDSRKDQSFGKGEAVGTARNS